MPRRALVIAALAATLILAGCLDTFAEPAADDPDPLEPQDQPDESNESQGNNSTGDQGNQTGNDSNGSNDSDQREDPDDGDDRGPDEPKRSYPPWPPVEEAGIRPGVQVVAAGSQCTSNFLFRSPDNSTLYLGLAAHCVQDVDLGDQVRLPSAKATATLAYSGWKVNGTDKEGNGLDFALLALPNEHRMDAHPATLVYGGPTALAPPGALELGQKVIWYGNSNLRGGIDEANRHEGYIVQRNGQSTFQMYTATPGVPGDSGSGVLTGDGRAAGVMVTVQIAPMAGANGAVVLQTALQQAAERGVVVELVTWELFDDGLAP